MEWFRILMSPNCTVLSPFGGIGDVSGHGIATRDGMVNLRDKRDAGFTAAINTSICPSYVVSVPAEKCKARVISVTLAKKDKLGVNSKQGSSAFCEKRGTVAH